MLDPAKRPSKAAATAAATASSVGFNEPVTATCKNTESFHQTLPAAIRPSQQLHQWVETESVDGDVTGLVAPQSGKNRRCCRNSTSSGYSSHSPPLSATSYGAGTNAAVKNLAVIHEGEIIPRPIWPSPSNSPSEHSPDTSSDAERDVNQQQGSLYGSAGYHSSCEGSGSDYEQGSSVSAREILLELSRTLTSVLEGDCQKSDEEILRDISRTVVQGAALDLKACSAYEEIYRNSSLSSSGKESASTIGVNPIHSRLYGHRCYCERKSFFCQSHPPSSQETSPKSDGRKQNKSPSIFLLPDKSSKSLFPKDEKNRGSCSCKNFESICSASQNAPVQKKSLAKQSRNQNDPRNDKDIRFNYPSIVEHEYTTLECSDESSSSEGTADTSLKGNTWCKDFRGFDSNLDFTLDGWGAERLGIAIARAKRRRQWCRVLVVFLGLMFFVLSVVVVSLSLTRGRKVFGSM